MSNLDLDRYEGHTPGPWQDNGFTVCMGGLWTSDQDIIATVNEEVGDMDGFASGVVANANVRLIADAPLLLAEVKRLRAENEALRQAAREYLAVSVPEDELTGRPVMHHLWGPTYRAKYEALEQLAGEE